MNFLRVPTVEFTKQQAAGAQATEHAESSPPPADPGPPPAQPTHTQQDFARIRAWGVISGIEWSAVEKLIELIPTLSTDTLRWGIPEIEDGGALKVAIYYGPVLGAWPADLKKHLQRAADQVEAGATVTIQSEVRDVLAKRADFDALVDQVGREAAERQLVGQSS